MMAQTGQVGGRAGLERNAGSGLQAPPDATSTPEADQANGVTLPSQGISRNGSGLPAPPAVGEQYFGDAPAVVYESGAPNTNRTGPGVGKVGI